MLVPVKITVEWSHYDCSTKERSEGSTSHWVPQISTDMIDLKYGNYPHIKQKDSVFNYEDNYLSAQFRKFPTFKQCKEYCDRENKQCDTVALLAEMRDICELAAIDDVDEGEYYGY